MEQMPISDNIKKILSLSMILVLISSFAVIFLGYSVVKTHDDIKKINMFLINTQNTKSNFEKSLQLYTDNTREIISNLNEVRPDSEEDYLAFLLMIEEIGSALLIKTDITTLDTTKIEDRQTLQYDLNFFGNRQKLIKFLEELEVLPYFIRVDQINFRNPELLDSDERGRGGNVNIQISLYTK